MLLSGLDAIQRSVAPVLVHYRTARPPSTCRSTTSAASIHVDDVNSPWALANRFREIFGFLQTNLQERGHRSARRRVRRRQRHAPHPRSAHGAADAGRLRRDADEHPRRVRRSRDRHLHPRRPAHDHPPDGRHAGLPRGAPRGRPDREDQRRVHPEHAALGGGRPAARRAGLARWRSGSCARAAAAGPSRVASSWSAPSSTSTPSSRGCSATASATSRSRASRATPTRTCAAPSRSCTGRACNGLVLDLRDDPGGLLEQAVRVSDAFLSSGTIVTTARNDPAQRDEKFARQRRHRARLPDGRARQRRQRLGLGDRRRRPQEPRPRADRRPAYLRQGLGAGPLRLPGRLGAQAHHRPVPDARRRLDPGRGHRRPTSPSTR